MGGLSYLLRRAVTLKRQFRAIVAVLLATMAMASVAQSKGSVALAAPACSSSSHSSQRTLASATSSKVRNLCQEAKLHSSKVRFWYSKDRQWMLYLKHKNLKCWDKRMPLRGPLSLCIQARVEVRIHSRRLEAVNAKIELLSIPTWCQGLSGNRALGCRMAYVIWPSQAEWDALNYLWDIESGWVTTKHNPSSDACGIPQGLNNCSYGYDPATQIRWGLVYIHDRKDYGSPSQALAHWKMRSPHWY